MQAAVGIVGLSRAIQQQQLRSKNKSESSFVRQFPLRERPSLSKPHSCSISRTLAAWSICMHACLLACLRPLFKPLHLRTPDTIRENQTPGADDVPPAPTFRKRLFDLLEANNRPGMLLEAVTVLLIVVNVVCFMLSTERSLADNRAAWLVFDSVELCTVSRRSEVFSGAVELTRSQCFCWWWWW